MRATIIAAIITSPRHRLAILIVARFPPRLSRYSFGQLASQVGAPAAYLRQLPAALAGINLQYGLTAHRALS